MIDVVIPYAKVPNDIELRMALRGLETYVTGIRDVWIVGDKLPTWITNVKQIKEVRDVDRMHGRERNIYKKIVAACENEEITDNFFLMHDDHFLLAPYNALEFPYYFHGILHAQAERINNPYSQTLKNGTDLLGRWARDFDTHCPILINKGRFKEAFSDFRIDWKKDYGYPIKSVYCSKNGIEGEYMTDCKFRRAERFATMQDQIAGRKWFSIDDRAMNKDTETLLQMLYPDMSKYEAKL